MPNKSIKDSLVSAICEDALMQIVVCDSNIEVNRIFDHAFEDVLLLQSYRYMNPRQPLPKSDVWYTEILPELDDSRFRQFMRVSRKDFSFIMSTIENDEVFKGVNSWKQFPVSKQLAITLYKLGMDGCSEYNVAAMFGVGDGGTVMKVISRVLKAILAKESEWIAWPNEEERKAITYYMMDKLPGCIGYIDGTHIIVDEAPIDDRDSYYTRKQRYAIQMQAICDNQKRIRNIFLGYPGSVHDARVFSNSGVAKRITSLLSEGEWLAGDSAYGNSRFVVTPFKSNVTIGGSTERQRKQFNKYFSGFRVNIECAFGKLKEVFQSLKGIRIRVDSDSGHETACNWIRACCILYNMILPSLDMDLSELELDDEDDDDESPFIAAHNEQRGVVFDFVKNKLLL